METFIRKALQINSRWEIQILEIQYESKTVHIQVDYIPLNVDSNVDIAEAQTMRYLPMFDYQTFITAPVVWHIHDGKRVHRLHYPWEENLPKDFNSTKVL